MFHLPEAVKFYFFIYIVSIEKDDSFENDWRSMEILKCFIKLQFNILLVEMKFFLFNFVLYIYFILIINFEIKK